MWLTSPSCGRRGERACASPSATVTTVRHGHRSSSTSSPVGRGSSRRCAICNAGASSGRICRGALPCGRKECDKVSPAKKAATGGEPAEPKQGRPADEATPRDAAGTPTENSGPEAGARRRRGSRGGRGRRKSPPQAMAAQGRAAQAAEAQGRAAQVADAPGDAAKDAPPRAARGGGQARGRGVKSPAAPVETAFALPTAPLVPIAASDAAAPPAPARGPAAPSATDVAAEPPAPSGGASKSRPRRRGSRRRGAGEGAAAEREAVATGSAQGSGEAAGGPPPAAGPAQAYRSVPAVARGAGIGIAGGVCRARRRERGRRCRHGRGRRLVRAPPPPRLPRRPAPSQGGRRGP